MSKPSDSTQISQAQWDSLSPRVRSIADVFYLDIAAQMNFTLLKAMY